jgi:hypothetical protein
VHFAEELIYLADLGNFTNQGIGTTDQALLSPSFIEIFFHGLHSVEKQSQLAII